jgi:glycosyltransferase involved in cell wall biosynthesis
LSAHIENHAQRSRPLVTLILPAFNEAAILEDNLSVLQNYLESLSTEYQWEVLIVDDGSVDGTREIADRMAARYPNVIAVHHPRNFGLGQALKTGFARSKGDYVVTIDVDLSYSPEHIGALLSKLRADRAKVVLASPYMRGGRLSNVPFVRRILSVGANKFLSFFARGRLSTITCMVRAYDGPFVRSLVLRSTGMDVMPETVYKSMILRAKIDQIPGHLDWSRQLAVGARRQSSIRIARHMMATVLSGFLFRPFMFFVLPGLFLFLFSIWVNGWMLAHFIDAYASLSTMAGGIDRASQALAIAYRNFPHTFIVGLLSLMLGVQLFSLGVAALQAKAYFEELFYLGSTLRRDLHSMVDSRHTPR